MTIRYDQLIGGVKEHIDSTSNPHSVTAHQIGADAILAEIDEYGSTTVGWDKVDKTGSSLADLATRNYSDLSNPPGDDSFHTLTEVSSSANSDEVLLYVAGTTNDYRKITKQNLLSGISVSADKIYQGNTKAEVHDAGSDGYFWVETEGAERFRINSDGYVGIGQIAPTAKLHIAAGTVDVNSAPIKLTSGTAMSTPEDGAVEYHSSHLYFTIGSTRYQIDQQSGGGGSGDVVGPSSATNEGVARFDTTTGKLIQNSLVIIGDDGYVSIPSGQKYKINGINLSATDVGAEPTQIKGTISSGTASAISIGNGSSSTVGPNVSITINKASVSQDGYLGKDNWSTFNSKENALTFQHSLTRSVNTINLVGDSASPGNSQYYGTNGIGTKGWYSLTSGSGDVVGPSSATNEGVARFDTTTGKLIQNSLVIIGDDGYVSIPSGQKYKINGVNLSATDVGAEPTQTKGTISSGTSSAISIANGASSTVGPNVSISINKASASLDGYLGKDNWYTFNNKASLANPIFTSKITIGVASGSTGSIELKGTTSGTCTITVPSIAGSPTYVLPAAYGSAGQILSDAAGNGILSWASAGSGASEKIYEGDSKLEVHDTGSDGYMFFNADGVRKIRFDSNGTYIDGYLSSKGLVEPISSKSSGYTTTVNDHTLLVTTGASDVTIILSSTAAKTGQIYVIKKVDSGAGYAILSPSSGTVDGQTTHSVKFINDSRHVQFDGTNWKIITSYSDSFVWKGTTSDAVATEIFVDGVASSRYGLTTSSTSVFELTCIARNNTDNKTKVWTIDVVTTTSSSDGSSIVGSPTYTVIAQSDVSGGTNDWAISVAVNDPDDTFRITVTGESSKTIQWVLSN